MAAEQLRQQCLALAQRHAAQVVAVEIDEVEGIEMEAAAGAFGQRVLQAGKARNALLVERHHLAIDDRLLDRQLRELLGRSP